MKLVLLLCALFNCHFLIAMHNPRPVTLEDLEDVSAVTERKDNDAHVLIGYLKNGNVITYTKVLSGENAGLVTCTDTSPDFWCKVFLAKLQQLRGSTL